VRAQVSQVLLLYIFYFVIYVHQRSPVANFKKPAHAQILLPHLFRAKNKTGTELKITPLKKSPQAATSYKPPPDNTINPISASLPNAEFIQST